MISLILPIRATQAVFSIIVMGLSGYVANWYHFSTLTESPSQVNFQVFSAVFSILSVAYLEGSQRFFPRAANPIAALAIEAINVIFFFSGFIALAVFINGLVFCRGTVCGSARASTAFSSFLWLLWSASLGLTAMAHLRNNGGGLSLGGFGRRSSGSGAMSQTQPQQPSPSGGAGPSLEKKTDSVA
ncbi:hypothetical protein GGTG_04225 [Gaeumannomyces tritici R3-111a-1]|uniref:MARVEL domain-containing protein n=1 Tax=Gaeumannomyces tritici (strain R3-111a-1) TaxID=644352 RepID=J3NSH3_GAET3|nr:hypothetical protein GGTG_04225 [Gaeumannomyces tritici R3-111a-1]EJT79136.1 hypothetical protein GGTG_04225 [Gaeumannomyces tritici R3-111a-1]